MRVEECLASSTFMPSFPQGTSWWTISVIMAIDWQLWPGEHVGNWHLWPHSAPVTRYRGLPVSSVTSSGLSRSATHSASRYRTHDGRWQGKTAEEGAGERRTVEGDGGAIRPRDRVIVEGKLARRPLPPIPAVHVRTARHPRIAVLQLDLGAVWKRPARVVSARPNGHASTGQDCPSIGTVQG